MRHARSLWPLVRKELRALLPVWGAGLVVVLAATWMGGVLAFRFGLIAYAITAVAIGALSFGHEFTHRTLPLLLAQPVRRATLLAVKTAVAVVLLAALVVAVDVLATIAGMRGQIQQRDTTTAILVLGAMTREGVLAPALAAMSLAPAMTLLARSALSGFIFALAVPALVLLAAEAAMTARFGWTPILTSDARVFRGAVAVWLFAGICAAALPAVWILFQRAQAIDGSGRRVDVLSFGRLGARSARRHPVLKLVAKELRLQQGTLAVAALYPVAFAGVMLFVRDPDPAWPVQIVIGLGLVHGVVVALMAGALASAEERQFGTLEAQTLLPIAASRQWIVKCAVTFGVALVLGIGVPFVLTYTIQPTRLRDLSFMEFGFHRVALVCALTTAAIYVSSLTTGGVRALVSTLPSIAAAVVVGAAVIVWIGVPLAGALVWVLAAVLSWNGFERPFDRTQVAFLQVLTVGLGTAVAGLVLSFAMTNHRLADFSVRRIRNQLFCVLVVFTIAVAIVAAVGRGRVMILAGNSTMMFRGAVCVPQGGPATS